MALQCYLFLVLKHRRRSDIPRPPHVLNEGSSSSESFCCGSICSARRKFLLTYFEKVGFGYQPLLYPEEIPLKHAMGLKRSPSHIPGLRKILVPYSRVVEIPCSSCHLELKKSVCHTPGLKRFSPHIPGLKTFLFHLPRLRRLFSRMPGLKKFFSHILELRRLLSNITKHMAKEIPIPHARVENTPSHIPRLNLPLALVKVRPLSHMPELIFLKHARVVPISLQG